VLFWSAKAAEVSRLQHEATTHQRTASTSREDLDKEWKRADKLDPTTKSTNADANTNTNTTGTRSNDTRSNDVRSNETRSNDTPGAHSKPTDTTPT
jgi:uncharacterized protein YdaT